MSREYGPGYEPPKEKSADARGVVAEELVAHIRTIAPEDFSKAVIKRRDDPADAARVDLLTSALTKVRNGSAHEVAAILDDEFRREAPHGRTLEIRRALREIAVRDAAAARVAPPELPPLEAADNLAQERLLRERRDQLAVELEQGLNALTRDEREFLARIISDLKDSARPDLPAQLVLRLKAALKFGEPRRDALIEQAEELERIVKM